MDPTALKMKRQQQVEEADHELTKDLFADVCVAGRARGAVCPRVSSCTVARRSMGGGKAPAKKDAADPGEKLKAAVTSYEIGSDEDLVQMGETLANSFGEALVRARPPRGPRDRG